jgi:hypothetical protein
LRPDASVKTPNFRARSRNRANNWGLSYIMTFLNGSQKSTR